jgi:hypothetical protein
MKVLSLSITLASIGSQTSGKLSPSLSNNKYSSDYQFSALTEPPNEATLEMIKEAKEGRDYLRFVASTRMTRAVWWLESDIRHPHRTRLPQDYPYAVGKHRRIPGCGSARHALSVVQSQRQVGTRAFHGTGGQRSRIRRRQYAPTCYWRQDRHRLLEGHGPGDQHQLRHHRPPCYLLRHRQLLRPLHPLQPQHLLRHHHLLSESSSNLYQRPCNDKQEGIRRATRDGE